MSRRLEFVDGSVIAIQPIDSTRIEVLVATRYDGSCLLYPQGREEAIALADALLAAVRAQDEARRAAGEAA